MGATFNFLFLKTERFKYDIWLHLNMKIKNLLQKLKGIQNIETIMDILNVKREQAIYYIHRLRKEGYVKTKRLSNNKRIYNISLEHKLKGTSYNEILNQNSPVKVITKETYQIYGEKPSIEETLIYAIKTKSLRVILSALALYKKITDWSLLYKLAKINHIERQVGLLYDLTKKIVRVKRMPKRFRNNALPKKHYSYRYIIDGLKSKDFKKIEKTWKIYLPFNKKDLEVYK